MDEKSVVAEAEEVLTIANQNARMQEWNEGSTNFILFMLASGVTPQEQLYQLLAMATLHPKWANEWIERTGGLETGHNVEDIRAAAEQWWPIK